MTSQKSSSMAESKPSSSVEKQYKTPPAKYKSKVWQFFGIDLNDDKKAVCKTCLQTMTYSGGTTNLCNNMKRHHGIDPLSKVTV